jgi:hypothetical protein
MTTRTTTPGAMVRRLAATGALAVTMFGVSVSAASAGTDESITTKRGSASFNDNTEIVTANDTLANKQGVQAFLSWKTKSGKGRSVTVEDGNGANNSPNTKHVSLPEGTKVHLKLCYVNNGTVFKCSKPQAATA